MPFHESKVSNCTSVYMSLSRPPTYSNNSSKFSLSSGSWGSSRRSLICLLMSTRPKTEKMYVMQAIMTTVQKSVRTEPESPRSSSQTSWKSSTFCTTRTSLMSRKTRSTVSILMMPSLLLFWLLPSVASNNGRIQTKSTPVMSTSRTSAMFQTRLPEVGRYSRQPQTMNLINCSTKKMTVNTCSDQYTKVCVDSSLSLMSNWASTPIVTQFSRITALMTESKTRELTTL
mmetsp:Transcript_13860/g.43397  ORF Transcript_13860/g.43397 Transcript_13860/m.43397 type:complete len:229 (-) Transcript_13860:1018-1704(-)